MASIYQCELNLKSYFHEGEEDEKQGMTFLQCMHVPASLSGTHTAACSSTAFFPDLRNRSYKQGIFWVKSTFTRLNRCHRVVWHYGAKNHLDALVDVSHPLLLLCCSCSKHCKGLAPANSIFWIKAATAKHKDPILKMLPNT